MRKKLFVPLHMFVFAVLVPALSVSLVACDPKNEGENVVINTIGGEDEGEMEDTIVVLPSVALDSAEAVDLGLSVLWASFNVGAEAPEDYGSYFAWGEIEEKEIYSEDTYLYDSYTDLGAEISGTEYDAAHVKWGNGWRMPTMAEVHELCCNCSFEWGEVEGVSGLRIIGNGNSIFLPASGGRYGSDLELSGDSGYYWLSTVRDGFVFILCIETMSYYEADCWVGLPIRPVKDK